MNKNINAFINYLKNNYTKLLKQANINDCAKLAYQFLLFNTIAQWINNEELNNWIKTITNRFHNEWEDEINDFIVLYKRQNLIIDAQIEFDNFLKTIKPTTINNDLLLRYKEKSKH